MNVDIGSIIAVAVIIGIPIALISAILLGVFWLFGMVNSYLATVAHLTGALLTIVAVVCTFILAYVLAYVAFWVGVVGFIIAIVIVALVFR